VGFNDLVLLLLPDCFQFKTGRHSVEILWK